MTSKRPRQRKTRRRQFRNKAPLLARQFLRERNNPPDAKRELVVRWFHDFLEEKKLKLVHLQPQDINELLASPAYLKLARTTRQSYRFYLYSYLDWLFAKATFRWDPKQLRRHQEIQFPLPDGALC